MSFRGYDNWKCTNRFEEEAAECECCDEWCDEVIVDRDPEGVWIDQRCDHCRHLGCVVGEQSKCVCVACGKRERMEEKGDDTCVACLEFRELSYYALTDL